MEYQKMLLGENPYFVSIIRYSYPFHYHSETEVLFCVSGEAKVIVDNTEYIMKEESVLLISSLAMHKVIIEKEADILVLEFGYQLIGHQYKDFAKRKFVDCLIDSSSDVEYKNRLIKPLKRLYKEHTKRPEGYQWVVQGLLFEIFAMIVRYVPTIAQERPKDKNLEQHIKIQKAFDLVHKEYAEDISLERIAAHVGYDKRTFCRIFKFVTNMTFHEYLNFYRISIAVQHLEHKSLPIGEIGQSVGIPVAKSFSRIFKKHMGVSPKEYRDSSDSKNAI